MTKSNLYTRSGDQGTTSLAGGQRVAKASPRLDAYGTVDEFSATLGVVLSHPGCPAEIKQLLLNVQNKLFNIGAYLATDSPAEAPATLYGLDDDDIAAIEANIDNLDEKNTQNKHLRPSGRNTPQRAHTRSTDSMPTSRTNDPAPRPTSESRHTRNPILQSPQRLPVHTLPLHQPQCRSKRNNLEEITFSKFRIRRRT